MIIRAVIFWFSLALLLVSWEMAILEPSRLLAWFGLTLAGSAISALHIGMRDKGFTRSFIDRGSFVLLNVAIFWWLLWLDLAIVKFAFPVFLAFYIFYILRGVKNDGYGLFSEKNALIVFLGGTFFWSTISFGLITVMGWQLWHALLIFLAGFLIFSIVAIKKLAEDLREQMRALVLLLLIAAEAFSVLVWLPSAEITLALELTIIVLFTYDLLKYFIDPELIRKKIIAKKILVYLAFFAIALLSTSWQ